MCGFAGDPLFPLSSDEAPAPVDPAAATTTASTVPAPDTNEAPISEPAAAGATTAEPTLTPPEAQPAHEFAQVHLLVQAVLEFWHQPSQGDGGGGEGGGESAAAATVMVYATYVIAEYPEAVAASTVYVPLAPSGGCQNTSAPAPEPL